MYDISQRPHNGHTKEGYAQEHNVKDSNTECVGQPDASTVHDPGVWVHLTVCHTHVHSGLEGGKKGKVILETKPPLLIQVLQFFFLPLTYSTIIIIIYANN